MLLLAKVGSLLLKGEKKFLFILLILTFFTSLLEILGISLIIPITYSLVDNEIFIQNKYLNYFINFLELNSFKKQFIFIISSFIFIIFVKSVLLTFHAYLQLLYFGKIGVRLHKQFFKDYIYSPWSFIMGKNTANLIRNFQTGINDFCGKILSYLVAIISEIILTIILTLFLLYLYPIETIFLFFIIFPIGYVAQKVTKKYNYDLGLIRQKFMALINKQIIQSFRIPKLLKIMGKEDKVIEIYENLIKTETIAKYKQLYIEKLPRIWIELLFLLIIVISILFLFTLGNNIKDQISFIIVFCLVGFRLLPSLNKILLSIQNLRYSLPAVDILSNELDNFKKIKIDQFRSKNQIYIENYQINLNNIDFKYDESEKYLFKNLNIVIPQNSSLALIGKSGVGKSTLGDIIMGVLSPTKGEVIIGKHNIADNHVKRSWNSRIGYVPQETYILDDSIKHNIALGEDDEKINEKKITEILTLLELENIIDRSDSGLDMILGENGVKLSGGQKQRIGIARALYTNPSVLILDEATSFLDIGSEEKIISILKKLKDKITIIFITHKKAGKELCDEVFDLDGLGKNL